MIMSVVVCVLILCEGRCTCTHVGRFNRQHCEGVGLYEELLHSQSAWFERNSGCGQVSSRPRPSTVDDKCLH